MRVKLYVTLFQVHTCERLYIVPSRQTEVEAAFSKTGSKDLDQLSAATMLIDCGNQRVPFDGLFVPSIATSNRFPIPEGKVWHILIVPTRQFWFSKIFSQTIVTLELKFGE